MEKIRQPIYAAYFEEIDNEMGRYWLVNSTNDLITISQSGEIHSARRYSKVCDQSLGKENILGKLDVQCLFDLSEKVMVKGSPYLRDSDELMDVREFVNPNLKIIDLSNDVLLFHEIKRVRWLRTIKVVFAMKAKWKWCGGFCNPNETNLDKLHPAINYHMKIMSIDEKEWFDLWPTTGKWAASFEAGIHKQAKFSTGTLIGAMKSRGGFLNG